MRAIIYTGQTGAGHTLAAQSLAKELEKNGDEVVIIDAFQEGGRALNRIVTKGYQHLVVNFPKLYKYLYKKFDYESKPTEKVLSQAARFLKERLLEDIEEYKPDLIISTHPIVTNIIGRLKDDQDIFEPVLAFVTDYIAHDVYVKNSIDAYIVGSDYTKQTLMDRGAPENRIYTYGIPVREEFRINESRPDNDKLNILLMAGSLGTKQLKKALKNILKAESDLDIVVVCGNNKSLKRHVDNLVNEVEHKGKDIKVLGFTDKVSGLMEESDVIITKPGGLTSTEAISKNIPIIIPYTYPGQEEENAKYLSREGLAIEINDSVELTELVDQLAKNPEILTIMSETMKKTAQDFSIEKTVELSHELVK